jgi:Protein of unknown function (DUF3137)
MPTGKSFDEFFMNELDGVLRPLEEERKKISRGVLISILFVAIAAILFYIATSAHSVVAVVFAFTFIVTAIIVFVVFYSRRGKYVASFKQKIVARIINFVDPALSYDPGAHIHQNDYEKSGLFLQDPDSYMGDDYVEGKRDKTFFCFSELNTKHKVGSGKNEHWETIFQGLFFIADFNKNFSGRTYVWSEENPQLNFFTKIFSSFSRGLEKVKLESTEFERCFIVYSNDQVEARYLLTPSFMERIMKLQAMMGQGISFSFVNTNINVAVPISGDLFEPSFFSANDYQKLGDYYNTVHIVFDIIDELKLNQRLWNKE